MKSVQVVMRQQCGLGVHLSIRVADLPRVKIEELAQRSQACEEDKAVTSGPRQTRPMLPYRDVGEIQGLADIPVDDKN